MSNLILSRRKLFTGLGLIIASPAIVKFSSLMPIKINEPEVLSAEFKYTFNCYGSSSQWTKIYFEPSAYLYFNEDPFK